MQLHQPVKLHIISKATLVRDSKCTSFTCIIVIKAPIVQVMSSFTKQRFQFPITAVSNGFVCKHLKQLKVSKATGLDCIPARLLKDGAVYISAPLTYLIYLSITTWQVPQDWKHTKIVP